MRRLLLGGRRSVLSFHFFVCDGRSAKVAVRGMEEEEEHIANIE